MKDLNELKKEQEDARLFWALRNIEQELPLIYIEFSLETESMLNYLNFLINSSNKKRWLEVIDWATTLAQNTKFDLLENEIDIKVMDELMNNLLEVIEIAKIKYSRELRG